MNTDIPVKIACTKYNPGATNINANSIGSVTPVKKLANPAANIIEDILALFWGFAVLTNARQAPSNPNIMIGKNPAWYIPVFPITAVPSAIDFAPPRKFGISFIPATSNQNTEFNAWCKPTGINNLLKNP